jgi:hypothetical protein
VTLQNEGIQDSTPIIEHLEVLHREPSIHPTDPVSHFVSILLEEFGDEWGTNGRFTIGGRARSISSQALAVSRAR